MRGCYFGPIECGSGHICLIMRVVKFLPEASRVAEPWKNGRGRTATVDGDADWRVSVAEVRDSSPFSAFPGASRILMPLSQPGLVLKVNGQRRALGAFQASGFEGEDVVNAVAVQGPTEVLNLIWQRRKCSGDLTALSVAGSLELEAEAVLVVIVTAGHLTVDGAVNLGRLDAVRLTDGEAVTLSGSGQLALACISQPDGGDVRSRATMRLEALPWMSP